MCKLSSNTDKEVKLVHLCTGSLCLHVKFNKKTNTFSFTLDTEALYVYIFWLVCDYHRSRSKKKLFYCFITSSSFSDIKMVNRPYTFLNWIKMEYILLVNSTASYHINNNNN